MSATQACGCFGALPFMAICCLAPNFYVSILLGLFLEYLVAECWFGPAAACAEFKSSTRLQCERTRMFRRNFFGFASRTR